MRCGFPRPHPVPSPAASQVTTTALPGNLLRAHARQRAADGTLTSAATRALGAPLPSLGCVTHRRHPPSYPEAVGRSLQPERLLVLGPVWEAGPRGVSIAHLTQQPKEETKKEKKPSMAPSTACSFCGSPTPSHLSTFHLPTDDPPTGTGCCSSSGACGGPDARDSAHDKVDSFGQIALAYLANRRPPHGLYLGFYGDPRPVQS